MMLCSRCGADAATASFCPNCGVHMAQQQPPAPPLFVPRPAPAPSPEGPPRQSKVAVVVAGVLAGVLLLVVVLGVGGFLLLDRESPASATLADQTPSTPVATSAAPPTTPDPVKKKSKQQASGPGDVRGSDLRK